MSDALATETVENATVEPSTDTAQTPEPKPEPPKLGDALSRHDASREAAKYRTRLRETEAERDNLTTLLTKARRSMVGKADAMNVVIDSGRVDLLAMLTDEQISEMFSDDGELDGDALAAAIKEITDAKPYFLATTPRRKPQQTEDPLARKVAMQAEFPSGTSHVKGDPLRDALRRKR